MATRSRTSPNLRVFARRIEKRAADITLSVVPTYKKSVANRILERLVMATPVDTSQALSNWQVATVATGPVAAAIGAYVVGFHGSSEAASTAATLAVGTKLIVAAPPAGPIVLSNVVDYIEDLAYPPYKSPQATYDWVSQSIALGLRQGTLEAAAKVTW